MRANARTHTRLHTHTRVRPRARAWILLSVLKFPEKGITPQASVWFTVHDTQRYILTKRKCRLLVLKWGGVRLGISMCEKGQIFIETGPPFTRDEYFGKTAKFSPFFSLQKIVVYNNFFFYRWFQNRREGCCCSIVTCSPNIPFSCRLRDLCSIHTRAAMSYLLSNAHTHRKKVNS